MMKSNMGKRTKIFFLLLVPVFLILTGKVQAEGIHARYLENSGRKTILELTVENPPPSSVIVKQSIPPNTVVESASPAYTKFVASKGVVTWLFKQPQPGIIKIVLNYTTPLPDKGATAVIRCKSPINGELMTFNVQ
ncbi:MAG: hypothetical protein K9K37_09380 [Desulfocapsa sp.]|nr:hypothetical protein [Desulfocapsa sp.]